MNLISKLAELEQSLWYDNIQRSILEDGSLNRLIEEGKVRGVTSNPSIFQKAISDSRDYDLNLRPLAWSGLDAEAIFWQLAIKDIQTTADLLIPIYRKSGRKDGFVSLEVNPLFARDTNKTIKEAGRLWEMVNRPNLMIKIPATIEGIPAIRAAISNGINVNVTLIFSLERYSEVMNAYLSGLEDRVALEQPVDFIASVASFFVSRVDTKVDGYLDSLFKKGEISQEVVNNLGGKAAIANAKLAYCQFEKVFSETRFQKLKVFGAQVQRPLWASTSTKNLKYRDVIYVEELIGRNTVNTVPPATLNAFFDHGTAELTIKKDVDKAELILNQLLKIGISIKNVTLELENEGVKAFSDAFTSLLSSVEKRREIAVKELGDLAKEVKNQVLILDRVHFVSRLYNKDATLWTDDLSGQAEIRERMNWLTAPTESVELISQLEQLLPQCRERGYTHAILLGMGGSSLAPEVLRRIHGIGNYGGQTGLDLVILDSTDPDQVIRAGQVAPIENCLIIVSSKSGSTAEINAFFDYFWDISTKKLADKAGKHFIAITDPNTKLEKLAREKGFWKVFNADPQVGGRNSALTAFGIVPAALIGMDIKQLLQCANEMAGECSPENPVQSNPGVVLGAILGSAAKAGRDKLTILTDDVWAPFGAWLEQLIAESSGKLGKGIVPVAIEPLMNADLYEKDRLFVYLRNSGQHDSFIENLKIANQPVVSLNVNNSYSLGEQFYMWEVATATACSVIGVNSFDQPDVQDAKTRTVQNLEFFKLAGKFTEFSPVAILPDAHIYTKQKFQVNEQDSLTRIIEKYLSGYLAQKDYVAINAFLPRNGENERIFQNMRTKLLNQFHVATTLGFGPRFLHSTGQLHKGGPNSGVFLMITAQRSSDIEIPGQGITFDIMQRAQAIGDLNALEAKGRRVLWIDLEKPDPSVLL